MATNKSQNNNDNYLGDYASKHPRRMYTGMLAIGTMLGAGVMAAKSRRDRANDPLRRLADKLSRD